MASTGGRAARCGDSIVVEWRSVRVRSPTDRTAYLLGPTGTGATGSGWRNIPEHIAFRRDRIRSCVAMAEDAEARIAELRSQLCILSAPRIAPAVSKLAGEAAAASQGAAASIRQQLGRASQRRHSRSAASGVSGTRPPASDMLRPAGVAREDLSRHSGRRAIRLERRSPGERSRDTG